MCEYIARFDCDDQTIEIEFSTCAQTTIDLHIAAENALLAAYPTRESLVRAIIIMSDVDVRRK